jgi:hypothetical protein
MGAKQKLRPDEAPKPEPAQTAKPAKYSPEIVAITRRANELRAAATTKKVGPIQLVRVMKALRERAEGDLTAAETLRLSGARSLNALRQIASGEGDAAPLKPLADAVNDPYARGRWLAAEVAAVAEALGKRS